MKNNNLVIGCVITAVVAGGVGFYGGTIYQQNQRGARFAQGRTPNASNVPNGFMRGGAVLGEITAKDDKSLTVKMTDGSSRMVILSDATIYRLSSESTIDEVAVGKTVSVSGTPNSDGSTTATSIELNPVMRKLAK